MLNGKTAQEYRDNAATKRADAQKSWENSDTDGFISQWASNLGAEVNELEATIAENDGKSEFSALFDLEGNLIPAKLIKTRYGSAWALLETTDTDSKFVDFFNPSRAQNEAQAVAKNAAKGYYVGTVLVEAGATIQSYGNGLAAATTAHAVVYRKDGGFSATAYIVNNK